MVPQVDTCVTINAKVRRCCECGCETTIEMGAGHNVSSKASAEV